MKIEREDIRKLMKNISHESDVLSYIQYLEEEVDWLHLQMMDLERENHCLRDEINALRIT